MQRLKTIGTILITLVVAAALTAAAMIQWSRASLEHVYEVEGVELALPTDPEAIEDGHRMYRAYGCAECHEEDGGGGELPTEGLSYVAAPNITTLAAWPVASFERAIRHGISPDGRAYVMMPANEYWGLDDESTARIIAFVRTLPPVGRSSPPPEVFALGHIMHALDALTLLPAERIDHRRRRRPMGERGSLEFGQFLAHTCAGCHGGGLSGGNAPGSDPEVVGVPPNLTPDRTGLATWSEEDFRAAMRDGRTPDGRTLDTAFMPWEGAYQYLTDDELRSLWLYLQSVPALPEGSR